MQGVKPTSGLHAATKAQGHYHKHGDDTQQDKHGPSADMGGGRRARGDGNPLGVIQPREGPSEGTERRGITARRPAVDGDGILFAISHE